MAAPTKKMMSIIAQVVQKSIMKKINIISTNGRI